MTSTLLPEIRALAERAGVEAMRFYNDRNTVTLKQDSSPLTDADRASHELIVLALPRLLPEVPVVSEESTDATLAPTADRFWLVDPLDGTKEFLKGTGEFTVNIALVERGRPILGVVHAPAIGLSYYADLAHGAFRQNRGESPVPIKSQRYNSARPRIVASKDHAGPLVQAMLSRLTDPELKSMGSSLKFCLVASGDADIYLRDVPTMEWDTAAAQCVVEAAGARLLTLEGQPLRYGKPSLKNPSIITIGDPDFDWEPLLNNA